MRVWLARRGPFASSTTLAPASCAAIAARIPAAPLPAISTSACSTMSSVGVVMRRSLPVFLHLALERRVHARIAVDDLERFLAVLDVLRLLEFHVHAAAGLL